VAILAETLRSLAPEITLQKLTAFFLLLAGSCAALPGLADERAAGDPLFTDNAVLDVTITAPLTTLVRDRPREGYVPGQLTVAAPDGSETTFDIGLRTRGHYRFDTCAFPPLRLNFKKSAVKGSLFAGQDKLKLVVHCENSARYEQHLLREYLAYRVLNLLTDVSFRVRLLRVTYVDSEERRKEQTRYAFLIEHKKRLAKRIGVRVLNIEETEVAALDGEYLNLTSLFQYFVGNTDFSPIAGPPDSTCCHNYVLFQSGDSPITAIPYDFDQSGFVDAPYAAPDSRLRIRTVTQRLYRGRCSFNSYVDGSLAAFETMREPIYALIAMQEGLDDRTRKTLGRFIDRFYDDVGSPDRVERLILDKCRG
jgi:hypothetical protein